MNIKAASEATGVSADTIRYYERIGLIPPVKRSEVGIRIFDDEDLRWISFSRQMRNAGISIEALIEYLILFKEGKRTVPARLNLLDDQKDILKNRIQTLQEALDRLNFKIDTYHTHMVPAEDQLRDFDE